MSSEVENNKEKALVDPLSEVTRKERRMLLGLSMLGVFFAKTGIVPSKISTLGIELAATEQSSFFYVLAAMLVYFAFALYAFSDFIVWKKAVIESDVSEYKNYVIERETEHQQNPIDEEVSSSRLMLYRKNRVWLSAKKPVSLARSFFEFILPIIVGSVSLFMVVDAAQKIT
ncbi:hypothetical protein HYO47_22400 [Vibrio parahaemolyticus]|uniref:hypothetical protein n=1 Tax=Vibrio parahaemolyticus TaxID=670 RepID=UPI00193FC969|nr:hypothetical protein [Vibrio parahaemolyticus]MBM4855601.1 hypothetical protein [Vibrio parahaemolyticus]WMN97315.1 hypothetical protein NI380_06845 [Vibrio parahaemolyticus]